jgi:hypothetical protein
MSADVHSASNVRSRAAAYIAKMGPAVQGEHGDDHTYKVAATLVVDFALSPDEALDLFRQWNASCQPPWPERDIIKKLNSAAKYGRHQPGAKLHDQQSRPDADEAYDVAGYCVFTSAGTDEVARSLAALDAAMPWKGPVRRVAPTERQAALLLALFADGRVERGPERVRWLMEQAAREHFEVKPPAGAKRAEISFTHQGLDAMATPQARDGHGRTQPLPTDGENVAPRRYVAPCAHLPEDPESICAREEVVERFTACLSPQEQKVFNQPFSEAEAKVANLVGTTANTVKTTRYRIRKKAKAWGARVVDESAPTDQADAAQTTGRAA